MKLSMLITLVLFNLLLVKQEYKTEVDSDNQFSITVPHNLKETNRLNPQASLQFQCSIDNLYVTVTQELKTLYYSMPKYEYADVFTDDLRGYATSHLFWSEMANEDFQVLDVNPDMINTLPAILVLARQPVGGHSISYILGFVEGKNHYYRIESFTYEDYMNANKEIMFEIIRSFREM